MLDSLLSLILGLILVYVLALLYKPYQYQLVEYNIDPETIKYLRINNS